MYNTYQSSHATQEYNHLSDNVKLKLSDIFEPFLK